MFHTIGEAEHYRFGLNRGPRMSDGTHAWALYLPPLLSLQWVPSWYVKFHWFRIP